MYLNGLITWNNSFKNKHLFAVGSSSQIQEINSQKEFTFLTIYSSHLINNKNIQTNCIGQCQVSSAFQSLSWSNHGDMSPYPQGLICGGMQDGSIMLFDANEIINYSKIKIQENIEEDELNIGCVCHELDLYQKPVYCVDMNQLKTNLIATASDQIHIFNIDKNISSPDIIQLEPNYHNESLITALSWNYKVVHILASASQNGLTVIWDLKLSKPIMQLQDNFAPQSMCKINLAWNPEIPTQLATASDSFNCEQIKIWDLRIPSRPKITIDCGQKHGIQSLSWCAEDPTMLMIGRNDNSVVCYDYRNGCSLYEEKYSSSIKEVKWSKLYGQYSVTLQSSEIFIEQIEDKEKLEQNFVPKWHYPLYGCNLSSQCNTYLQISEKQGVNVKQVKITKQTDVELVKLLQSIVDIIERSDLSSICEEKIQEYKSDQFEAFQWRILNGLIPGQKETLLNSLGYNKIEIVKQSEKYTGKIHRKPTEDQISQIFSQNNPLLHQQQKQLTNNKQKTNFDFAQIEDAEGFFDQLSAQSIKKKDMRQSGNFNSSQALRKFSYENEDQQEFEQVKRNINWNVGVEKIIKENIIIGNYEGAIDCALKCGRLAEALLIAYSQKQELFKKTIEEICIQNNDPSFNFFIKSYIDKNINEIVATQDLRSWKECAGILLANCKDLSIFFQAIDQVGLRFLQEKNDENSALFCFLLAKNFDQYITVIDKIYNNIPIKCKERQKYLTKTISKLLVLQKIIGQKIKMNYKIFDKYIFEISRMAYDQSQIINCYSILSQGSSNSSQIAYFKDIIYHSHVELQQNFKTPTLPYKIWQFSKYLSNNQEKEKYQQLNTIFQKQDSKFITQNQAQKYEKFISNVIEQQCLPLLQNKENNSIRFKEGKENIRMLISLIKNQQILKETFDKIIQLFQEINNKNWNKSLNILIDIASNDWVTNKIWIQPLKRIVSQK